MLTIARLTIGDIVTDSTNAIGKVAGLSRDHVVIAWDRGNQTEDWAKYTDADLKAHGVRVVDGQK